MIRTCPTLRPTTKAVRGFSFIELLLALLIAAMMVSGISMALFSIIKARETTRLQREAVLLLPAIRAKAHGHGQLLTNAVEKSVWTVLETEGEWNDMPTIVFQLQHPRAEQLIPAVYFPAELPPEPSD